MKIERVQKYLSRAGVCSRRSAEKLIKCGRVSINGNVCELGSGVEKSDIVTVDGQLVSMSEERVYIMLHKPEGYVTTSKDQFERPTVLDLVKEYGVRLYPVGRLDYDSSGLVILTNDGALTFALTHPSKRVEKIYIARVVGIPTPEELENFRRGVVIDDYRTAPAGVQKVKEFGKQSSLKITLREGKNRQVRKMCEAIGHPVVALKRVATGRLYLGDLPRGSSRALTKSEIAYLKDLTV
ncbi:MAG: rRNA pseudouridine synthase [Clostridiales bacterium]|nr:rRNA pseudouridine synthase [Clostridiales bacterium]